MKTLLIIITIAILMIHGLKHWQEVSKPAMKERAEYWKEWSHKENESDASWSKRMKKLHLELNKP